MKVKDIFTDTKTNIFLVTDSETDNELEWTIAPTNFELLPEGEASYFVKAKQVYTDKTSDCYISITTPERIAEVVIKRTADGQIVAESVYDQPNTVIPAVASDCFGDYNLFYAKENPQVGIDILKGGLTKATNKNIVAEDLGYILRDEERTVEALDAFKISEQAKPSSKYIYLELSRLYKRLGQTEKQLEYENKFKAGGELANDFF